MSESDADLGVHHLVPTDGGYETLLTRAAYLGLRATVKMLLARPDVDPNERNSRGMTALMQAAKEGKAAVAMLLLKCDDIDVGATDEKGYSALRWAAERGQVDIARTLILDRSDTDVGEVKELLQNVVELNVAIANFARERFANEAE